MRFRFTKGAGTNVAERRPPDLSAFFTPMGIAQTLFSGLMSVLTTLIIFAPAPTIYKVLREDETGVESAGGW